MSVVSGFSVRTALRGSTPALRSYCVESSASARGGAFNHHLNVNSQAIWSARPAYAARRTAPRRWHPESSRGADHRRGTAIRHRRRRFPKFRGSAGRGSFPDDATGTTWPVMEPPADDPGQPLRGHRHVSQHPGVNREVVDALFGLFSRGIAEGFPGQVLGNAVDLLQRLVNRDGTNRHRACCAGSIRGSRGYSGRWRGPLPCRRPSGLTRPASTSSSMEEVTAELPILAFTFTRKLRPIIIGSDSGD